MPKFNFKLDEKTGIFTNMSPAHRSCPCQGREWAMGHTAEDNIDKIIGEAGKPTENIRVQVLNKAKDYVSRDRQNDHGKPENTFSVIAELWSAYLTDVHQGNPVQLSSADVAALMILLKVGRISQNPHNADNWVDAAGYAACGGELAEVVVK